MKKTTFAVATQETSRTDTDRLSLHQEHRKNKNELFTGQLLQQSPSSNLEHYIHSFDSGSPPTKIRHVPVFEGQQICHSFVSSLK